MTKQEIEKYEYCKKHIQKIEGWQKELKFKVQEYGCGSSRPNIEHTLEKIHRDMHKKVISAMTEAKEAAQKIIDEI